MSKRQLIEDIRRFNESVQTQFLLQFDEAALKQYLDHLENAKTRNVRIASWVRQRPRLKMVS